MKKILCALLLFSLCMATLPPLTLVTNFIDHAETDSTGNVYRHQQQASVTPYYTREDIRYSLVTHMEAEHERMWLSGTGSYDNLRSGDSVCEGRFYYTTSINTLTRNFYGQIPSYSGAVVSPDHSSWVDCVPHPSCPSPEMPLYWNQAHYDYYKTAGVGGQLEGGPHLQSSAYGYRSITYYQIDGGQAYPGEVAQVATVGKGTATLRRGTSTIHNFGTLSGTNPASGQKTMDLHPSSYTQYTFTQRLNVAGALMGVYNPNFNADREDFYAYTNMGLTGQNPYTNTVQASGILNVYPEDSVGIIPPSILFVDMGSDGIVIGEGPYVVNPGESVPVTIKMFIPNRPSDYYALTFEFFQVSVPDGTFTATSGLGQCNLMFPHRNGGWFISPSAYKSDIIGTFQVPENAPPGIYTVDFCVQWRSCEGQHDCDGNAPSGIVCRPVEIMIPSGDLPDLVCTVEPIVYVDGTPPGPDGFGPGQGVESWRVTVTNEGAGDFNVLNSYESFFCSMMMFQAYSSDNSPSLSSPYLEALVSNYPGTISAGESRVFEIDAEAVCVPGIGDEISAGALVNFLGYSSTSMNPVMPACVPHFIQESNPQNNLCSWTGPCDSGPADGVCVIVPSNVNQPPSGSTHDFTLTCGGGTCTGPVSWGESHAGDIVAFLTSGQQTGATANAITYSSSDEISGTTTLTATVGYPDNMVCNATITLQVPDIPENGGEEDHCTCIIDPSTGYPGSEHALTAMCHYDGESEYCSSVSWSITSGEDFVETLLQTGTWWSWLKTKNNIISGDEETISILASTDAGDCYCHLPLPPMDCLDFL